MIPPTLYVLTRTANRPRMFAAAKASVDAQRETYAGEIVHVVHAERTPETLAYATGDVLVVGDRLERTDPRTFPWERYLWALLATVRERSSRGWVLFLDDDDVYRPDALASVPWTQLAPSELPIWRTEREGGRISPAVWRGDLGSADGRICWESAAHHVSAIGRASIGTIDGADGRYWHALSKVLTPVWFDHLEPLARPQVGKGKGRALDYARRPR